MKVYRFDGAETAETLNPGLGIGMTNSSNSGFAVKFSGIKALWGPWGVGNGLKASTTSTVDAVR